MSRASVGMDGASVPAPLRAPRAAVPRPKASLRTTAASLLVSQAPRRAPTASVASRGASRRLRRDARRVGREPAAIHDGCSTKIEGSCASASGCPRSSSSTLRSTSGDPAYARGSDAHSAGCPARLVGCPAHSRGCSACSSGIPWQTRRRLPRSPSIATCSQPSRGDTARRVACSEPRRPPRLGLLHQEVGQMGNAEQGPGPPRQAARPRPSTNVEWGGRSSRSSRLGELSAHPRFRGRSSVQYRIRYRRRCRSWPSTGSTPRRTWTRKRGW